MTTIYCITCSKDWEKTLDSTLPKLKSKWIRSDSAPGSTFYYTVECITNIENINDKHPPQVVYRGKNGHVWSLPLKDWPGNLISKID
jgi:hypothetical protein